MFSNEFLLKNLKTISKYNKKKLAANGYLILIPLVRSDGRIYGYEETITDKGKRILGIIIEEISSTLKFCSACGKGHWRKGKQYCTEECKEKFNREKREKRLDYDRIMADIRAKKEAKKKEQKQKQRIYYIDNREKILDYQKDYQFRKQQDQILLTILTTTI